MAYAAPSHNATAVVGRKLLMPKALLYTFSGLPVHFWNFRSVR